MQLKLMLAPLSISWRIAFGFGITFLLLGGIVWVNNFANSETAAIFEDYRSTAKQTLFVNDVFDRLSKAQSAIIDFRVEPSQQRAASAHSRLDDVVNAKERIGDAFDLGTKEARTLRTLLEEAENYRDLFSQIERHQLKIDEYQALLQQQSVDIRRSYNGLVFMATINSDIGASSDATLSKDAFLESRYATRVFLQGRDRAVIEAAKQQLHAARSTLDTLSLRAADDLKPPIRTLLSKLDRQLDLTQRIQDAVEAQDATNREALQQVGPALRRDFEAALQDVIASQRDLGMQGAARIDETANLVMGLAVVAVLVGSAFAWAIGHWISCSVREIAETMTKLSNRDLNIEIAGTEYTHEFGAMARALEIFQSNAQRLSEALEKERELNGQQRQFVSMVSHEFRTPLAIIDANAQRIIKRHATMPTERMLSGLGKVRTSVKRLTELMESVLNASRLESGTIVVDLEPCDIGDMIREVVGNYQEVSPGHTILADISELPDLFTADLKLIRQVVSNLLSNAIKYSPEGSTVRIKAGSQADRGITIAVHDQGVGVPEEEVNKLFERFFRATTSTGIAGTGIGLHMVKAIIDLHHGHIDVTSSVGVGTTFTIYLPPRDKPGNVMLRESEAA
jgi:signal transduction histidine kinase